MQGPGHYATETVITKADQSADGRPGFTAESCRKNWALLLIDSTKDSFNKMIFSRICNLFKLCKMYPYIHGMGGWESIKAQWKNTTC